MTEIERAGKQILQATCFPCFQAAFAVTATFVAGTALVIVMSRTPFSSTAVTLAGSISEGRLLRWREGKLERLESNGLLFGVIADPDYPVRDLPIRPGDRLLLYTDGVVEPESALGESFGDVRLEELIREKQNCLTDGVVGEAAR